MLVSEVIVGALRENGVSEAFGLPGGEVLDFVEACRRLGLEFILMRHESAASFAADVTGQITGRPGVCVSTLGPGATNMVTGVANAYLDRSPVIAITGQMSPDSYRDNPHQRLDLGALYRPITKWSVKVTPRNAGMIVPEAIKIAMRRPRGPVHLELANTVSRSEAVLPGSLDGTELPDACEQPSTVTVKDVVERLGRSKRPAILVGVNVDQREVAGPVMALAESRRIPVLVSAKAKGVFPHDHPLFVGVATGMAADDRVLEFIEKCDILLGVGFDASESDKAWPATAPLVWIEEGPRDRAEWPGDYLVGSVPDTLAAIASGYAGGHQWTAEEIAGARAHIREKVSPKGLSGGGLSPAGALLAVREALPGDGVFVCDVGAHKLLSGQAWPAFKPLTFFMSNGLSSMGYGVPGAIAAKRALDRPVVAVVGDGGFGMMIHEIETAVRMELGVVFVVFNDECLSLIQVVQSRRKFEQYGVDFRGSDWAAIAEGFGAKSIHATTLDELRQAVSDNIRGRVPCVVDVPVNRLEYLLQI